MPASGYRNGAGTNNVGSNGNYWSSTPNSTTNARNVNFNSGNINPQNNNNRYNGFAVRLVRVSWAPRRRASSRGASFLSSETISFPFFLYVSLQAESSSPRVSGPFGRPPRVQRSFLECMGDRRYADALREERMSAEARAWLRGNLMRLLYRAYRDARESGSNTYAQVEFESDLWGNLRRLRDELLSGSYRPSRCLIFTVSDPVLREVIAPAFRDQVVDHLLYSYLAPIFEKTFIEDSYSCRKGKGTSYGVDRLEHHLRSASCNWIRPCVVLQCDVSGYFMSIDHCILYDRVMGRLIRGGYRVDFFYPLAALLIRLTIFTDPTVGCLVRGKESDWAGLPANKSYFNCRPGTGLPIGKLTSQLFSNVYLDPLDQFVKRVLKVRHYGRYVDDFFAVVGSFSDARALVPRIRKFLRRELRLRLHPRKVRIRDGRHGVTFLGVVVRPGGRSLCRRTERVMRSKVCDSLVGEWNLFVLDSRLESFRGHLKYCRCPKVYRLLDG